MKNQLRNWSIALLAAVAVGGTSSTVWAQRNARSVVAGRQQVRAALAVAMADGKLTTMEQYSVLLKGKKLLAAHELEGLKQTLLRLSDPSRMPSVEPPGGLAEAEPVLAKQPWASPTHAPGSEKVTQTKLAVANENDAAEQKTTQTTAHIEPAEPKDDDRESPFKDEELPEEPGPTSDPAMMFSEGPQDCDQLAEFGCLGMPDGCGVPQTHGLPDVRFLASVDAFKGPLDLDNQNGNFGLQFGVNVGLPLARRLGIGVQAGTSGALSDFHGTRFTGSTIRSQNFTTVGLFQRVPFRARRLQWGFAFDWLYDDYYSELQMTQWRVKLAYQKSCSSEIGICAHIPNDGDTAILGDGTGQDQFERFKPIAQGLLYYSRCWETGAGTTAWLGVADTPGEFVLGGDFRVPLTHRWAFVGNANYLLPSASGAGGQDEEQWYVSVGVEFTPGSAGNHCLAGKFSPIFPLANNGTFAFRRF